MVGLINLVFPYSSKQFLKGGTYAFNEPPFFLIMGTKRPMFPGLSCLIKSRSSHHPFALSCTTTNHPLIHPLIQTTNHSLIPLPNSTNHTPTISSTYQPPTPHVNVGSQPHIFQNPLDHAQVGPLPLSIFSAPIVTHN